MPSESIFKPPLIIPSVWSAFLVPWGLILTATLVAVSLAILCQAVRRARGTTLLAPLVWSLISLVSLMLAYANLAQPQTNIPAMYQREQWWFFAICSSFCPMMALLGAKRPQNRMWQYIVISFWIIAALPAIQAAVLHPQERVEVASIWSCLYLLLFVIELINFLPTRYAFAAILVAAGQFIFLSPYLLTGPIAAGLPPIGLIFLGAGISLAYLSSLRRLKQSAETSIEALSPWNRVWIDFSNAYGLVWGVRVMDRIETVLQSTDAQVWLQWSGFRSASRQDDQADALSDESSTAPKSAVADSQQPALQNPLVQAESSIRSLLLRFVSKEWIDLRLNAKRIT